MCQLSIYNSFPLIRTTIVVLTYPGLHFLFALGTPLWQSRKTLHEWKDNSVLAKCTHLSSTLSQLFEPQVQKIAVFMYRSPHFCFPSYILWQQFLPCDAMHKRGLCRHAVSVTFMYSVEINKYIFKKCSQSGNHTLLVLPHQMFWQYSNGKPLTGASNADGVKKICDSQPISGSVACRERFDHQVQYTQLRYTVASC